MGYLYASPGGVSVSKLHASHTTWLLVVEHDIRHGADLGAFVSDIFFNVEDRGGVFLILGSRHVSRLCDEG